MKSDLCQSLLRFRDRIWSQSGCWVFVNEANQTRRNYTRSLVQVVQSNLYQSGISYERKVKFLGFIVIFLGWWRYPLQKRRENCMMTWAKRMVYKFSRGFWCGYLHQPKKYYNDSFLIISFWRFKTPILTLTFALLITLLLTLLGVHFRVRWCSDHLAQKCVL